MKFSDPKVVFALAVLSGTILLVGLILFFPIPVPNKEYFGMLVGAWVSLVAMVGKRVLDGNESSDAKNETIKNLSQTVTGKTDQ